MTMWKRWSMVAAALLVAAGYFSVQAQETYKARLSPLPADAKTRPDLAGSGTVTAVLAGTKLTINGSFDGLKTPAVVARLHNGVAAGVRGPAIQDLTITKAASGTITGIGGTLGRANRAFQEGWTLRPACKREDPGWHPVGLVSKVGDASHEKTYSAGTDRGGRMRGPGGFGSTAGYGGGTIYRGSGDGRGARRIKPTVRAAIRPICPAKTTRRRWRALHLSAVGARGR